jgi:tRNA A-37 threonylcarbamoyl transferase component Bud32
MSHSLNVVIPKDGVFVKIYGPKKPLFKYYSRCFLDSIGLPQPIEYQNESKRLKFECKTLELWKSHHFNVPSVAKVEHLEVHLSIIKGRTLYDIFSESVNLDIVAQVFHDMNDRHQLALKINQPILCHVDANLKNIMYSDNKIYHIDFEMGREYEVTDMWAQREVTKLLISLSKVTNSMQSILALFFNIYTHTEIIEQFTGSKLGNISQKLIAGKLNKGGYTLINLAVEMKKLFSR